MPWLTATNEVKDHPRVCGEKYDAHPQSHHELGSFPRVRGKVIQEAAPLDRCGIIPACAGKSIRLRIAFNLAKDHPRVCGEKMDTGL